MGKEMNAYWLCCGSLVHKEHKQGCNEHLIGHPERRRFGTAEEHKEWQKTLFSGHGGQTGINM